jgi:hypothetical protein
MYIEIYNIGVLTVNIELNMWWGIEMEERWGLSSVSVQAT